MGRLPFTLGDNCFAVSLEIINIAMGVFSGGRGECLGVQVEGAAGCGKATESKKATSVGLGFHGVFGVSS